MNILDAFHEIGSFRGAARLGGVSDTTARREAGRWASSRRQAATGGSMCHETSQGRRVAGAVLLAAITLMAAGCGALPDGVVRGQATPCPGPGALPTTWAALRVRVLDNGQTIRSRRLTSPWRFAISLPPGVYTIEAPGDASSRVQIRAGSTVTTALPADCGSAAIPAAIPG
ncbi:MAG TPA: hypothetical protein VMV23_07320 [Candidatus Nanopelagicaceae bacterium]|nr:hypothetical protein [Candidatus Nanopelagicaceae bacterium]